MVERTTRINPHILSPERINELFPMFNSGTATSSNTNAADPLNGLNINQWNLSSDAKLKIQYARFQFGLSYNIFQAMNTSQGQQASSSSFSLQESYNLLNKIHMVSQTPATPEVASPEDSTVDDTAVASHKISTTQELLKGLQDFFSPENVAQRILDVATSYFSVSETVQNHGNTEESRALFADLMEKSIDQGFTHTQYHLGDLPDDIQKGVDETHALINEGLAEFAKSGIDKGRRNEGSIVEKIAEYYLESAQWFDQIKKALTPSDYNSQGKLERISMETFSKNA